MASEKPLVLVLGGTGYTGQSVVGGLTKSGNFRVAAFVRPTSVTKPATETLRTAGVEIRVGDFTDDFEKLKQYLHGVDILISAVDAGVVGAQREIFRAAKEVGVQRVVPCDWATPSAKGVILINDLKLEIREYLRDLGVGYTFIDVGWWMQLFLPLPLRSTVGPQVEAMTWRIHGAGENRNLLTDLHNIGTWTAKIIADPRTLNKTVIIWEDEVKEKDAHEIGARVSGDEDRLREKRIQMRVPVQDSMCLTARSLNLLCPMCIGVRGGYQEANRGRQRGVCAGPKRFPGDQENTLENAKRLGYLDARELCPDLPAHSLEDFAKKFYSLPEPGELAGEIHPRIGKGESA
ncbi:NAD(P)-binding protein [Lentinus tigrinus ALCF2SS1-6]|uniref:NAD(P)-binding protein n=1 Tax=Lentinus tigrinus ALCF2SS1-6 TaxID=1328759 RepID=A0A5C2RTU8_9APHY|nr:NAD(P)-binding protein [Lentinus tigrinus ALCF2SS1-6]